MLVADRGGRIYSRIEHLDPDGDFSLADTARETARRASSLLLAVRMLATLVERAARGDRR